MALSDMPALPTNATIEPCSEEYLQAFRRMNATLLPIPYNDSFYKETLSDPIISSITRVAVWHNNQALPGDTGTAKGHDSRVVAAIRCRLLSASPGSSDVTNAGPVMYISTLTTLAPFRGHGLASQLLSVVAKRAVDDYGVRAIVAHVWEANDDGLHWYTKRGFQVVGKDDMYYRRLAPRTAAFLVRQEIGPSDLLGWESKPFSTAGT